MAIAIIGTGAAIPIALLPDRAQSLIQLIPSAPITDLVRLGWVGLDVEGTPVTGADVWRSAARSTAILLAWLVVSCSFVRRRFR